MNEMEQWLEDAKQQADEKKKAEKALIPKGQCCKTCSHYRAHQFSPKYHYCTLGRSQHTPNGYAKTSLSKWCKNWKQLP